MAETASPEVLERFKEGFEWWNCSGLDLMLDRYAEDAESRRTFPTPLLRRHGGGRALRA